MWKKMKCRSGASPTGLPEDIVVAEILPRLHIKPLFTFKCVSKLFNSIISDPNFERSYMQRAYSSPESSASSGLFPTLLYPLTELSYKGRYSKNIKKLADAVESSIELHHADVDDHGLSINVSIVSLPYSDCHKIIGSSNGLILYCIHLENTSGFGLCVSNPLTKQCVRLPDPCSNNQTEFSMLEYGIVARRHDLLTYKIVLIHRMMRIVDPWECASTTVEIFSSDTGRWASRQVDCPGEIVNRYTTEPGAAYRGILHWLDCRSGTVITYDPYDNPDRFARIPFPSLQQGVSRSLIYSGDQEMLKYCEIENGAPGVDRLLSLWRLVDSSGKGECWCLEGMFWVPSLLHRCNRIMVAPYPWSRDVLCHPIVKHNNVTVINPTTGTRKYVDVFMEGTETHEFDGRASYLHPLIPVELCPWSCPFYAQSS